MNYSNPFSTLYAPYLSQPYPQTAPQFNIGWTQGEVGAKQHYVPPNSTTVLFDGDDPNVFYWKSTDSSGMPTIRIADYTFRDSGQINTTYVSKDDLEDLKKQIQELKEDIDGLSIKRSKKKEED